MNDPSPTPDASPTVADLLRRGAAMHMDRLDVQMLVLKALGRSPHDRAWVLAHDDDRADPTAAREFDSLCARRLAGEPIAYLVGRKEFRGLDLTVDRRVLVPRPDTETLVDWALHCLRDMAAPRVLDLGTGSGAIALAIRQACADADVTGVDMSMQALEVATDNAQRLGLPVNWLHSDWFSAVEGTFDLIVSNPPYIAIDDPHLAALRHEPLAALAAGAEGLDDIRRIVAQAPMALRPDAWLLLEHGHEQASAVRDLLSLAGFVDVQSRADLAGIERVSGGIRPTVK